MTPTSMYEASHHSHHFLSATVLRRMSTAALGGTVVGIGIALVADILFRHPVLFFLSGHGYSNVDPIVTQVVLVSGAICGCMVGTLAQFLRILVEALQMHAASLTRICMPPSHIDGSDHEQASLVGHHPETLP